MCVTSHKRRSVSEVHLVGLDEGARGLEGGGPDDHIPPRRLPRQVRHPHLQANSRPLFKKQGYSAIRILGRL